MSLKYSSIYLLVIMEQYEVVKQLGAGSFGRVVKAYKKGETQMLAIKQIKMTSLSDKQKDGALNEIRLLASISSPNVVSYYTAFFDQNTNNLCIVMEYADGGDLAGMIEKKKQKSQRFNENFIWQVAHDLLKAMKMLHSNKIIHRDIKPGNVFFVDGVAKLGDLNISKVMEGNFASTQAGTPYYTSPQIWNGQLYDGKCDIWSLGCLLYEIATLRPPFLANDFPSLSKKVNQGYYDPIPIIYSARLSDLIKNCLKVRPYERHGAIQLLNDSVFQFMQNTADGSVNLLSTIRCPRILKMIQQKLPDMKSAGKKTEEGSLIFKPKVEVRHLVSEEKYRGLGIRVNRGCNEKQNTREKCITKYQVKSQNQPSQQQMPTSRGIIHRMQPQMRQNRQIINSPPCYYKLI